jgi:TRAP-type mannitol/chloroaromatic compound transport system permease small subunit
MDVVYSRCSPRTKAILDLITAPIFFCFAATLLWTSGEIAWESIQELERSNSQWRPPIYPIKSLIPVAALLVLLQGVAKFVRDVFTSITGKELS